LESVVLKKKAYWMATVLVRSRDSIAPEADGRELLDLQWFSFADALQAFDETNHPEKAALLSKALHACERDLLGGPSPAERRDGGST
jgi:NADH pyrophosphatase NudC (nudix superfamily)